MKCIRCGNEALKDFKCQECDKYAIVDADEGTTLYNEEDASLFEIDAQGDEEQVACSSCGSKKFDIEYQNLCSRCKHQAAKD
jgi:transcription elongation factor Elf1